MASFTDQIPQFNPYVSQQPVDAMVKVGMMKQQQYNTNLDSIYQSMGQIEGLDIIRDVDKEYLQDKMNNTSDRLRMFAAGDFSQNSLTRNVKGMINSIADDEIVQNSVMSTQQYRNQMSVISKAQQDGTLTPDNYYYFQKQAAPWLQGQEAGQSFNAQYTPYFDVLEYTKEVFNEIKPDGMQYDDIFSGVDKSGNPILSPAMKRMKKEGIMPEKARMVIDQVFSDPRVKQQLQISGEYNYRNVDSDMLKEKVLLQQSSALDFFKKSREQLEIQKQAGQDVQAQIDELELQAEAVKDNFSIYLDMAENAPDALKGLLYTEESKNRYSKMFSNVKESMEYISNPVWEGEFKLQKEANENIRHRERMDLQRDEFEYRKENDALNREVEYAKIGLKKDGSILNTNPVFQSQEPATFSYGDYHNNQHFKNTQLYTTAGNELVWEGVLKGIEGNYDRMVKLQKTLPKEKAIEIIIKEEAEKQGMSVEDYKARKIVDITSNLANPETLVNTDANLLLQKFYQYDTAKKRYTLTKEIDDFISEDFETEMSKMQGGAAVNGLESIDLGNGYVVTPQDIIDFRLVVSFKNKDFFGGSEDTKTKAEYAEKADARLRKKFPAKIYNTLLLAPTGGLQANPEFDDTPIGQFSESMHLLKTASQDLDFTDALNKKEELIKKVYSKRPNLTQAVIPANTEAARAVYNNIQALAAANDGLAQDPINESEGFKTFLNNINAETDPQKININAHMITNESGETKVLLVEGQKGSESSMAISVAQAKALGINVDAMYEPDEVTTLKMYLNNNNSTSPLNPSDINTYRQGASWFKNNDFPKMTGNKVFNVQANIEQNGNSYTPYVYFQKFDPVTGEFLIDDVIWLSPGNDLGSILQQLKVSVDPQFLMARSAKARVLKPTN